MLQTQPPPPSWFGRIATAAIVLGLSGYFAGTALTMGADGFDDATAVVRVQATRGVISHEDIPAGTYDLSWVTVYGGEPATTGWNINVRIIAPGGADALNKTYAWSETVSCFSCSNTYGAVRTTLDRVELAGGNYTVEVRINYSSTTGSYLPTRTTLSFLSPERVQFFAAYPWIGLGFLLLQLGIVGLWRRGNRKRFAKWYEWKRRAEGEPVEEKKKRFGRGKAK